MSADGVPEAPGAVFGLGHVPQLWRRPLPFLRELTGGPPVVVLRLGGQRAYLASSPEAVAQVMHQSRVFDKGGPLFEKARAIVGDGLVSSDFDTHRRQRRLMQPAFTAGRMPGYAELMSEQIGTAIGGWQPGRPLELGPALHTLALRVAARTMVGAHLDSRSVAEIVAAMPVIMRGVYQRMIIPGDWVHELPLPANRRFAAARSSMQRIIADTVRAYRLSGADHGDVLSILVRDHDGAALGDDEIHDQVMTLLIGGTEPPGNAMTAVFHFLGRHPEAERALHAEVDDVLDGGQPSLEHLPALPWTQHVVLEALRLLPPAWLLSRSATCDTELAGCPIPAGATVLFSPYQQHHDPRIFPDPLRFDPGRWAAPSPAARAALMPFGAGNRKCIGDEVALTELMLTVAAITSRLRLRPVPGSHVREVARASLGTTGVVMTPEPRHVRSAATTPG